MERSTILREALPETGRRPGTYTPLILIGSRQANTGQMAGFVFSVTGDFLVFSWGGTNPSSNRSVL